MKKLPIHFFEQDVVCTIKKKNKLRNWINTTINAENFKLDHLNFIFCADDYLLKINLEFLNHDTLTDIITFDNSEVETLVAGEIYISIDRLRENAKIFNTKFTDELHRVIIHGTLHLLGYQDKSAKAKKLMTKKEDEYLAKRCF